MYQFNIIESIQVIGGEICIVKKSKVLLNEKIIFSWRSHLVDIPKEIDWLKGPTK